MSCFICSDKTLSNIAYYICRSIDPLDTDIPSGPWTEKSTIFKYGAKPETFFKYLYDLNRLAYCERYDDGEKTLQDYKPVYTEPDNPSLDEVIVGLECFLYQCCEGDVPDTSLYLALVAFQGALCRRYVTVCSDDRLTDAFNKYWQ